MLGLGTRGPTLAWKHMLALATYISGLAHRGNPFSVDTRQPLGSCSEWQGFQPKLLTSQDKDKCSLLGKPLPNEIRGRVWHACNSQVTSPIFASSTPAFLQEEGTTDDFPLHHARCLEIWSLECLSRLALVKGRMKHSCTQYMPAQPTEYQTIVRYRISIPQHNSLWV